MSAAKRLLVVDFLAGQVLSPGHPTSLEGVGAVPVGGDADLVAVPVGDGDLVHLIAAVGVGGDGHLVAGLGGPGTHLDGAAVGHVQGGRVGGGAGAGGGNFVPVRVNGFWAINRNGSAGLVSVPIDQPAVERVAGSAAGGSPAGHGTEPCRRDSLLPHGAAPGLCLGPAGGRRPCLAHQGRRSHWAGCGFVGGGGDRALEHDILWSSYRYGTGAYSRSGVVCQEGERLVRYFVDCGDSGICELWLDRRRVLPVEEEQLLDRFTGMA